MPTNLWITTNSMLFSVFHINHTAALIIWVILHSVECLAKQIGPKPPLCTSSFVYLPFINNVHCLHVLLLYDVALTLKRGVTHYWTTLIGLLFLSYCVVLNLRLKGILEGGTVVWSLYGVMHGFPSGSLVSSHFPNRYNGKCPCVRIIPRCPFKGVFLPDTQCSWNRFLIHHN